MTETRLSGILIKTGSIPTSALGGGVVSSSAQILTALPTGTVSSSTQINTGSFTGSFTGDFFGTASFAQTASFALNAGQNIPAGTVSSSAQVISLLPTGTVSASSQVNYTELSSIPSGIVSSSTQIPAILPNGTVSASSQVAHNSTTGYVANEHINHTSVSITAGSGMSGGGDISTTRTITLDTGSAHFTGGVTTRVNSIGVFSSSAQVSFTSISNRPSGLVSSSTQIPAILPAGTVSASSQVVYTSLSSIPSGIVSSSTQIPALLPNGTVSSSTQLPSGIVSSSTQIPAILPNGTVSASSQVVYTSLSSIPSGIVSSSTQIPALLPNGTVSASSQVAHGSTTGYIANEHINHTSVSITAGSGMTGGGDISTTRTLTLDTSSAHFTGGVTTRVNALGVFSSSAQVSFTAISNRPSGLVSSSTQIPALLPNGTVSASSQVNYTQLSNIPSGIVSSSTQIPSLLPAGTVSSSGQVAHNSTSGYVANEHINHTSVTLTAGNGLTGGGNISANRTFAVGAGLGITVNAADVAINTGSAHFVTGSRGTISSANTTGASGINLTYNTATGIISSSLVNSSVTVNGQSISLGGSGTVTANTTNALTLGNGLTGTSFNGSSAVTATVDTGSTHFTNGVTTRLNALGVISSSAQVAINSTTGTLNVNKGGTGQTSYVNGELLIGNTTGNTLTKATLTGTANRILITNGAGSITINADADSANTVNKIVARDASGNFTAGTITATLSGTATNATNINTENRTTNESGHLVFIGTTATGNVKPYTNTNVRINPSTGQINASTFNATSTTDGGFQGIAADTVTTPSFTWTDSLTTGIYHPTTTSIGVTIAGVERMRVDNSNLTLSGSLIIGTQVNKATITYATDAARTLTIPNVAGNRTFAFIDQAQTFSASQTFSATPVTLSAATAVLSFSSTTGEKTISTAGTTDLILSPGGNVGIGTTTPSYKLEVNGSFAATTKSFVIDHQSRLGKKLVYGVLEGPEHGVYVRGKLENSNIIELPSEWKWLVDADSITVQLTPIGSHQKLYVKSIDHPYITIENGELFTSDIHCHYLVHATRKDVPTLQTVV